MFVKRKNFSEMEIWILKKFGSNSLFKNVSSNFFLEYHFIIGSWHKIYTKNTVFIKKEKKHSFFYSIWKCVTISFYNIYYLFKIRYYRKLKMCIKMNNHSYIFWNVCHYRECVKNSWHILNFKIFKKLCLWRMRLRVEQK